MIVDWHKTTFEKGTVFHFKNSLKPFIEVNKYGDYCFLDLDEMKVYTLEDLDYYGFEFYNDEVDDDFMGVEIDGKVEWVS